jgi:hypothetical protein
LTVLVEDRYAEADVDYLVASAKFIRVVPTMQALGSPTIVVRIQAEVFKRSEPHRPIKGLLVMAKARQAPSGVPKPTPSSALEWNGKRIRGLNYELWHDNPDGSVVKGWHEHLWSPEFQDSYVVPARPKLTHKGLTDIFTWSLRKWNIKVLENQKSMLR